MVRGIKFKIRDLNFRAWFLISVWVISIVTCAGGSETSPVSIAKPIGEASPTSKKLIGRLNYSRKIPGERIEIYLSGNLSSRKVQHTKLPKFIYWAKRNGIKEMQFSL